MQTRSLLVAPLLALGALVVLPAPAAHAAGVLYASPSGVGLLDCGTPATACNIEKAVGSAGAGDQVVLAPGTYATTTQLSNANGIYLHGTAGQARPVISSNVAFPLQLSGDAPGTPARVSDLSIVHSANAGQGLRVSSSGIVERVDVRSSSGTACEFALNNTVRDTLCVATGADAIAISAGGSAGAMANLTWRLRNVTAIATGPLGTGVAASLSGGGKLTVDLRNVIASGGGEDIAASTPDATTVTVVAQSSNYDKVTTSGAGTVTPAGSGTNQTAAPVFTDATTYHEAATSPTVDAGTSDGYVGATDLDGQARLQGPAVDIGADETARPVPPPLDTAAPDTALGQTPKKRTTKRKARFTFTASEAGATFTCRVDKKAARPCTSPFTVKVRPGKHTLSVAARDAAGNVDATPATCTWKVRKKRR
ncbi:hypothetical protein G5V58_25385 [Nocardioides anomalus]|uniref:Bacterial Ig-like domain-containing protein n=1 Tax=Nocardioides anomalus TaxID=2712223 RepID=A0A6G6WJW5_9ACTN|nr:choice-of-anchor Q domain-containing protein [Nocardioides anomalus]QIG45628.1 hypothetical protein G5V58_25385 [Nocardioides anomalus]